MPRKLVCLLVVSCRTELLNVNVFSVAVSAQHQAEKRRKQEEADARQAKAAADQAAFDAEQEAFRRSQVQP